MDIRKLFRRSADSPEQKPVSDGDGEVQDDYARHLSSVVTAEGAMRLSTVFRCVELLSNSVAQLPVMPYHTGKGKRIMYEHPTYRLLAYNPNRRMTRYTFFKQLVVDMLLGGNAYAFIERDIENRIIQLVYVPSEVVSIVKPYDLFGDVKYVVAGINRIIEHTDMIHILNHSLDGIEGISTIHYATQSLTISNESEINAKEFLRSNVSGLLSVESALSENQIKAAKKAWNRNVSQNNGIAVLSGGWRFQPITLNSRDSQLIESREFNSVDIARWFGVNLSKLGIDSSTSYGGIEQENLAYLTDTLNPLLQKIECELERKLYTESERQYVDVQFDVSSILRVDLKSKIEKYRSLFNIGVLTINEIRELENLQPIENGDKTLLQVNMTTLDNIVSNKEFKESKDFKELEPAAVLKTPKDLEMEREWEINHNKN